MLIEHRISHSYSFNTPLMCLNCRNTVYDSSMGACLHALHSTCPDDVVEFTARDLVNVFPQSLQSTESPELKVCG